MSNKVYTRAMWREDKILLAKGIFAKKYTKAYDFLHNIHLLPKSDADIDKEVNGALFILGLVKDAEKK